MLINGFVIKSIEGRIMAGVVTFVAVMILVGWIAINEPARMASFEQLHLGRAIERGGELFASSCSNCHGADGLGKTETAPALNNPMLFGHPFLSDINGEIAGIERQWKELDEQITALETEKRDLTAELGNLDAPPDADRRAFIEARLPEINALLNPDAGAAVSDLSFERDELNLERVTPDLPEERIQEIDARLEAIDHVLRGVLRASASPENVTGLTDEQAELTAELEKAETTDEREAEINARLAEIQEILAITPTISTSLVARISVAQAILAPLYAQRNAQLLSLDAAILKGYMPQLSQFVGAAEGGGIKEKVELTAYIDQDSNRLTQVGWGGDLASYIRTTLIHGRPGSNNVWPLGMGPMSAWSQLGGGPMRTDQINDIVSYILNWDKGDAWTLEDLYAVNQFTKLHGGEQETEGTPLSEEVDINDIDATTALVMSKAGSPSHGEAKYNGQERTGVGRLLGCSSCHLGGTQGPPTADTWANVLNIRLNEAQFAGWTPEKYIVFSVTHPSDYVVPGFASGLMPETLPTIMNAQDMADIVAYLHNFYEPVPEPAAPEAEATAEPTAEATAEGS